VCSAWSKQRNVSEGCFHVVRVEKYAERFVGEEYSL
jgi:hypothetical protein